MRLLSKIFSSWNKQEEVKTQTPAPPKKTLVSKLKRGDKVDGEVISHVEFVKKSKYRRYNEVKVHFSNGECWNTYQNVSVCLD